MNTGGKKLFSGVSVFMSRNLVPPEVFASLLDALKTNGADIFMCCDPSRSGPSDYHVISSPDHERFEDLRDRGCNLLGPQCVLSCAKEQRALPKQVSFTCCLAMDGVRVLASGFDMDEKLKIHKMVTAMCGTVSSKACLDINFVVVKNVLAAKYKWALNTLKKPILSIAWLHQCWSEHRVVPQESYRVLPFSGLTICVTRIPADERGAVERITVQNGGKYSPELTRKCTHLICDAAEGDKFKVAQRWGHIHIVSRKWFDQSVSRKACLNEDSYSGHASRQRSSKEKSLPRLETSQSGHASMATESDVPSIPDPDLETSAPSQHTNGADEKDDAAAAPEFADDSQTEGCDLYLADCRILLTGFEASEMRKLVSMVRNGGGSRYMSLNEKLTHVVVGSLSESAQKDLRSVAALGVIRIVKPNWLEDCDRQRKETSILQRHDARALLFAEDALPSRRGAAADSKEKHSSFSSHISAVAAAAAAAADSKEKHSPFSSRISPTVTERNRDHVPSRRDDEMAESSGIFSGKLFCFSSSFPHDRRGEVVEWINEGGGGTVRNDAGEREAHFTVECHGDPRGGGGGVSSSSSVRVSTHWIRSCLEDGRVLDVSGHILYSPLQCEIPLRGFERFRFCVSQYEGRERNLLRNLCFVLGSGFMDRLTKKVTHLLCEFTHGPKYEAASKWNIPCVRSEWIVECVKQNAVVGAVGFRPREPTADDMEAGACRVSQYPTQYASSSSSSSQWKRARLSPGPGGHDVVSAIEDLLEQTSKIREMRLPEAAREEGPPLPPRRCPILDDECSRSGIAALPNKRVSWVGITRKEEQASLYFNSRDSFSETQTESQVVGYEEDLSGRQMIIDRVLAKTSMASDT